MTAYSVTRPEDQDRLGGVVVEIPSVVELRAENERLRAQLSRASRVLASLARLSPRMADVIAVARREIWRLDE